MKKERQCLRMRTGFHFFCLRLTLSGILFIFHSVGIQAQFSGHSGVYYLGTADVPISVPNFQNPSTNGVVVRFKWNSVEPTPGNFNWSFVDGEIAKALANGKKISLQPLGKPTWLKSIGAQEYFTIERSTFSPNLGQVVSGVIPWDSVYVKRYSIFLQQLAQKYAGNQTVTYVNAIGGNFSRGLPDTVLTDTVSRTKQAFWTAYPYNADTLGKIMNRMTDQYMALFPSTPLWCSVDYVTFQPNASGQTRNYLATLYCNYGIEYYPDRFGLFREDISGCNPNLANINVGSHWYLVKQNLCRTGAQMLWSVQDGPLRMNACGIVPNSKVQVLDSAVNKALALGMRYLEIYGNDITDPAITTSIQTANNKLIIKGSTCDALSSVNEAQPGSSVKVYPNPAHDFVYLISERFAKETIRVSLFSSFGKKVKTLDLSSQSARIRVVDLPNGLYFIQINEIQNKMIPFIKE